MPVTAEFPILSADPLQIRESTAPLLLNPRHVSIDRAAIVEFVDSFGCKTPEPTAWDSDIHFQDTSPGGADRVAGWIMALDALNFCFWSTTEDRWRVTWRNKTSDGYFALASALSRAVEDGCPLWDPQWLRNLTLDDVFTMLRPDTGSPAIPLLELRHRHLVELGVGLGDETAGDLLRRAGGSAIRLIEEVLRRFPSFRDVAIGPSGMPVYFYKRAQILIADLAGALAGTELGTFRDTGALTAFADYKVPQVMRRLGILVYGAEASERIQRKKLIRAGSLLELEIRAATIWGCELIRQEMQRNRITMSAADIDWLLWTAGQTLPSAAAPYHRTLTPFY